MPSLLRQRKSTDFSSIDVTDGVGGMDVMEISPRAQALMLLFSALVGVAAGVIFDLFEIFRKAELSYKIGQSGDGREAEKIPDYFNKVLPLIGAITERKDPMRLVLPIVCLLADILFPVAWAASLLCVFYAADDGVFRISGILATFLGFYIWKKTLGVPFLAAGTFVIYLFRVGVAYLLFPIEFVVGFFVSATVKIFKFFISKKANKKIIRYDKKEKARLLRLAQNGYL